MRSPVGIGINIRTPSMPVVDDPRGDTGMLAMDRHHPVNHGPDVAFPCARRRIRK